MAAANVSDANDWTVAAYPNTDDDKSQVLDGFLQAGGCIYAQRAGKISCIQRAAPRASVVTISAADTAGPLEIDTAASRIDRINTLRPRFWSEAHRWQMTALDGEITAQAYRDEDGAARTRGLDFPFVSNARQCGQLAALQIANTREGIAGVIPLKPHMQRVRPGDAFTITEPGFVLNGVKCLCLNTDYDPATGVVRASFVSETDAKYPFAMGQNQNYSARQVYGPYTAPALIGDVMPNAPGLSQIKADIEAAFGDIFDVSGLLADARADIDAQGVEIAAARGGQPNLNSRILELNQAQIDGDEANAQAISLVQARTENTEADIIDLANAQASEAGARAEAIQQVNARLAFNPNLQPNPTFANGFGGYSHDAPWITVHNRLGDYAQIDTMALPTGVARILEGVSPAAIVGPGEVVTISADAFLANTANDPNGGLRVQILWRNASNGAFLGGSPEAGWNTIQPYGDFTRKSSTGAAPNPTDGTLVAAYARVYAFQRVAGGVRNIKVEDGSVATLYSDDATASDLYASVTEQSLAIIDLENQQAIASWRIKSEATGSKPAIIEAVSALGGSFIAFSAEQIYFGDNTVFDDATDTFQTEVDGNVYVRAEGAPFGLGGILREWWGPSGIALSEMTPANGYSGRIATPPYVFDNMGPGFSARANSSWAKGTRPGAGSVTTGAIVITPTGATATVDYRWWYISGDTSLVIGTTRGGASATWQTTLAEMSSRMAVWGWSATMSGQSHTGVVEVLAQSF